MSSMSLVKRPIQIILAFLLTVAAWTCPVLAVPAERAELNQEITIQADGRRLVDGRPSDVGTWDILTDRSVFRYRISDDLTESVNRLRLTVSLPVGVSQSQVKPNLYAVHGAENATVTLIDDRRLLFAVDSVGPAAEVTLTLDFPPEAIRFSSFERLLSIGQRLPLGVWLTLAMIMPALIGFYLIFILVTRGPDIFLKPTPTVTPQPPSALSPALVGLLVNGFVGVREIAATFVDLAKRGYIDIIYRGENDFGFSQKRPFEHDPNLLEYERLLLYQVFNQSGVVSDRRQIKAQLDRHIWSDSVSQAIESIYGAMERLGYFNASPKQSHLAVRLVAILIFFLSVVGLAASFFFFPDQPLVLIPWIVSLAMAPFLNRIALLVTPRTSAGREQAASWLAFRHWLTLPQAARYVEEIDQYERYLAYSIALGVESQWTARYAALPLRLPTWFYSQAALVSSYQQLATILFSIIGFIGQKFSFSRKPTAV